MIICHCQNITDHDIRAAADWMRAADPDTLITPGKIYRALGRRADCGGCLPLFLDTLATCESLPVVAQRGGVPYISRIGTQKERHHEGRSPGHRLSQPRAAL
jgi:bacterioferritin-associated ferredoxin